MLFTGIYSGSGSRMKKESQIAFIELVNKVKHSGRLQEMKNYTQHGRISTYHHCYSVAETSYKLKEFFHISVDEDVLIRGAMLHDYFLYDWHSHEGPLHGFYHPIAALANANQDFQLSEKEQNIIYSHMWPLTITKVPRCREAWIVSVADKIVSTKETLFKR